MGNKRNFFGPILFEIKHQNLIPYLFAGLGCYFYLTDWYFIQVVNLKNNNLFNPYFVILPSKNKSPKAPNHLSSGAK